MKKVLNRRMEIIYMQINAKVPTWLFTTPKSFNSKN